MVQTQNTSTPPVYPITKKALFFSRTAMNIAYGTSGTTLAYITWAIIFANVADPEEQAKQKDACKSAFYLKALAANLASGPSRLAQQLIQSSQELAKIQVYRATAGDAGAIDVAAAIQAIAQKSANGLATALPNCIAAANKAAQLLNIMAGVHWSVARTSELATTGDATGVTATGNNEGNTFEHETTLQKTDSTKCADQPATQAEGPSSQPDLKAAETVILYKLKQNSEGNANKFCQIACKNTGTCTGPNHWHVTMKQTTLLEQSKQEVKITQDSEPSRSHGANADKTSLAKLEKELQWALTDLKKSNPCDTTYSSVGDFDSHNASDLFRQAVMAVKGDGHHKYDPADKQQKEAIDAFIKSNYGENQQSFSAKVWSKITQASIQQTIGEKEIEGKIDAVVDAGNAALALAQIAATSKCASKNPAGTENEAPQTATEKKKKRKTGIIKRPHMNVQQLKRKIVTRQNAIGTLRKNSAKLRKERLLFLL
uniref:Variant surface glycoprotein 1125.2516 n=1 Tax=Trypanosoma brucei TaxID=5691 RepID=A0A1J0R8A1_9TRYP|nr:variant surface glycoprotein 1125.2516 [Trypanosoma brucei]